MTATLIAPQQSTNPPAPASMVANVIVPTTERERWPWYLGVAALLNYLLVSLWLVNTKDYLLWDGVERTSNAMAIVMSRDPHLGAMGLYWMPLPMLARIPALILLRPFGSGIYAGPITSALAGALVIPVLAKIGRTLRIGTVLTAAIIVIYAFNPITTWHAANGMSESWFALCYCLLFLAFVKLVTDPARRSTHLLHLGLALGLGVASRFEFLPVCFAVVIAVALQVPKEERRQAISMAIIPSAFVFFFWSLASALLAGDAFLWYTLNKSIGQTPGDHPWMPDDLTIPNITGYIAYISLLFSPALVGALVIGAFHRRSWRPFAGLVLIALAYPGVNWFQLVGQTGVGAMRYFGLIPLLGTVLALWVTRADGFAPARRRPIAIAMVCASALGVVTVTYTLSNPTRTSIEKEAMFFAPLLGRDSPGYAHDLAGLDELAGILDSQLTAGRLVAMDSKGGWLTLYSHHPERFILPFDRDWEQIISDPDGRFDFVVKPTVGIGGLAGGDVSQYTAVLERAMTGFTDGEFQMVATTQAGELWEFVPTGASPTIQGELPAEPAASEPAVTTTTAPAATTSLP